MTPRAPEHPAIINRPDLLSRRKRAMFSGITLIAWVVWFYLFLPLISAVAWWAGAELFASYMLDPDERTYLMTLLFYVIGIATAGLVIFSWSRYNQLRFQGHDRRAPMPAVTDAMIQARFRVDAESLHQIHNSQIMRLHLDDDGLITAINTTRARPRPVQIADSTVD
jgi:biofilm PGA synthesis protein PgaD